MKQIFNDREVEGEEGRKDMNARIVKGPVSMFKSYPTRSEYRPPRDLLAVAALRASGESWVAGVEGRDGTRGDVAADDVDDVKLVSDPCSTKWNDIAHLHNK